MLFGVVGYLVPAVMFAQGLLILCRRVERLGMKALWMFVALLSLVCLVEIRNNDWSAAVLRLDIGNPGGLLGVLLARSFLIKYIGGVGTAVLSTAVLLMALVLILEIEPVTIFHEVGRLLKLLYDRVMHSAETRREQRSERDQQAQKEEARRERLANDIEQKKLERKRKQQEKAERKAAKKGAVGGKKPAPFSKASAKKVTKKSARNAEDSTLSEKIAIRSRAGVCEYSLPPLDLLDKLPVSKQREKKTDFRAASQLLEDTLAEFGIEAEVTNVEKGPVVTSFELRPAPGVRVERIANLANNIALTMKAKSVRVQAPIPGKGVVGIEVPNAKSTMVYLRELLECKKWKSSDAALPLVIGKDVGGKEIIADLGAMPHLLIAGATGAGKTVCMNSLLAGLLMSCTPEHLRLMLVDPKIVEFSFYNHLPHLVVPVITDPKKVGLGLRWAINEMESRYKMFAKVGVRDIKSFNSRPIVKQEEMFDELASTPQSRPPDRIPYIVIVIDELADLMMVAQAEVENSIARLAQLSRAVGIHMIIATQRPSVNVITGTIKANFPARLAFQVAQKVDSRTILDGNGADKLLGKGDMLFAPPGSSRLIRSQGTMTTDNEIRGIVDYWKSQGEPEYEMAIKKKIEKKGPEVPGPSDDDDMLETAIEVIRQTKRASTSSLQRRLRIGYTRAARLMDILEEKGMIGPPRGSDPREILIDLDGEIPQNETDADSSTETE